MVCLGGVGVFVTDEASWYFCCFLFSSFDCCLVFGEDCVFISEMGSFELWVIVGNEMNESLS